ncbi:MAG: restriction endonuclease [Proteobacteria bacterium]|nr:restriction endonuclease [Pseudomonadota bacterium]
MAIDDFPDFIREHYEIHQWRHATAILAADFPAEFAQIKAMLQDFRLYKAWIESGGGRKTRLAEWVDHRLGACGWRETKFATQIKVDANVRDSPTHKIDCFKNRVALEVEWNNKDPFYDRDLNNFRLLFDLQAISVGVIFTRSDELQDIFDQLGRGKSYGNSTTHMSKLLPKIEGGGGGGCPLLVVGIGKSLYTEDLPPALPTAPIRR